MCTDYEGPKAEQKAALERKLMREVLGFMPRGRIRPTDPATVAVLDGIGLICRELLWGWSVPWDKKPLVNAKSETLTTLPTFQPHLKRRCLILASRFKEGGAEFYPPDGSILLIAGLWIAQTSRCHFVMLTTSPNASVAPFHDRMPFIVSADDAFDWLMGDWQRVLAAPDKSPLEKFQKQPELF